MLKQELAIYDEYRQRIGECDEQLQSCLRTFNLVSNLLKSKPYLERFLESARVVRFLGPASSLNEAPYPTQSSKRPR